MKSYQPAATALLAILCASPASWADLKNPTYLQAKQSYAREDWAKAQRQLRDYMREDAPYLDKHPEVRKSVEAALHYCIGQADHSVDLAAVSAALDADPPPELP